LSYRWTGTNPSDELYTLYRISESKSWFDFRCSFNKWYVPSLNFTYCDIYGNIGLVAAGSVPERNEKNNMIIPGPGWITEYQWSGIKISGIIEKIFNPEKNYVASANNPISRDRFLSYYYDISSRANRINELISQYHNTENYVYTYIDAQRMQSDILSDYARELCKEILPVISYNLHTLTKLEMQAYQKLKKWDFIISPESSTPTIFNIFIKTLIKNIFLDELGVEGLEYYTANHSFSYKKTMDLLKAKTSSWFDNIRSKDYFESRTYIVMISFKETIQQIKKMYNTDNINKWEYGIKQKIHIKHQFKDNPFLEPLTSIETRSRGGDNTTINLFKWDYHNPFMVSQAPAMRIICDMSDSFIYISVPGGVSEDPMEPDYKSQLHLWQNGAYIGTPISALPPKSSILFLECYN